MKKIKSLFLIIITFLLIFPTLVNGEELDASPSTITSLDETTNLYLFYSKDCSHCKAMREYLDTIKDDYDYLNIIEYEVIDNKVNYNLMIRVKDKMEVNSQNVPFAVIGTRYFIGYNEDITDKIKTTIESKKETRDIVYEVENNIDNGEIVTVGYGDDNIFTLPLFGKIDAKKVSLPIISIVIGAIDGFNPCAMWVLIFLISMLIGIKNRKRMLSLGITFLVTSALVYLLFMVAWLNIALSLTQITWIRVLIALVALIGGTVNVRSYIKTIIKKDEGCEVVDTKKRKKIIESIKKFTTEKSFILATLGVVALAFSVNLIELACSAGLPLIFTQILALNSLSGFEYALYLFLYILFFLLDDLIVFIVAMVTFKVTGISTKYTKYSHLIGGVIMLLIGILMIFKPSWLMFNF